MNISRINVNKLKIALNGDDMRSMRMSFDDLDYTNHKTKEAMIKLLDAAKEETGFDSGDAKLFIEVYPEDDGGCVIYFTALNDLSGGIAGSKTGIYGPVVFEFSDLNILITVSCRLFDLYCHRIYKSSIYKLGEIYYLLIFPLDKIDSLAYSFVSEYGKKTGEGHILSAYIEEHGSCIVQDVALETMSSYFGGR